MVLVLIDMQPDFRAARFPRVIKNCIEQVKMAIRKKMQIIFCEYIAVRRNGEKVLCRPTDERLMELVVHYKHVHVLRKERDDASPLILKLFQELGINPNLIVVGGVNLGACVADTAFSLALSLPNSMIEVVKPACGHWTGRCAWSRFPKAENIVLREK